MSKASRNIRNEHNMIDQKGLLKGSQYRLGYGLHKGIIALRPIKEHLSLSSSGLRVEHLEDKTR